MNEYATTCQDLQRAIDDFVKAVDDWVLRRNIVRLLLPIIGLLIPGYPIIDPDTATNAELEAWVNGIPMTSCVEID